uniref:non-specific serine/threonine protein kinase n=1 Tax=Dermatophagoides pteronyssinus TaxID=6956 RepID=A0A6P6Y9H9_DERPT|nr:casein kinase I-like [Dermatophagoides pteronyssinus]
MFNTYLIVTTLKNTFDYLKNSLLVSKRWKLTSLIGKGSFGTVYKGYDALLKNNNYVAIKFEKLNRSYSQLINEGKILNILKGIPGIPIVYYYGIYNEYYYCLVIELLGKNLDEVFNICNRNFTLYTGLIIIDNVLTLLEHIHARFIVHRDIKPQNIMFGLSDVFTKFYMIDFGLSKQFRDDLSYNIIKYRENKKWMGTVRFASIGTHLGLEQSYRDDLESLGYTIIYLLKGKLPWQCLKINDKNEKHDRIRDIKISMSMDFLTKNLPVEFKEYFTYFKQLNFFESPNYSYLRLLFRRVFIREKFFKNQYSLSWIEHDKTQKDAGKSQKELFENYSILKSD